MSASRMGFKPTEETNKKVGDGIRAVYDRRRVAYIQARLEITAVLGSALGN